MFREIYYNEKKEKGVIKGNNVKGTKSKGDRDIANWHADGNNSLCSKPSQLSSCTITGVKCCCCFYLPKIIE